MTGSGRKATIHHFPRLHTLASSQLLAATLSISGCAVHYYDRSTGTEHVWGLAHMKMRVEPSTEGVQAVVQGNEALGFSAGTTAAGSHLALGWHDESRILVSPEDTALRFEWPSSSVFDVRVGTRPPLPQTQPQVTKERP